MTPSEALKLVARVLDLWRGEALRTEPVDQAFAVLESALVSRAELPAGPWRVGRSVGRTLYVGDVFVGLAETPELASAIVEAMNRPRAEVPADVAPRFMIDHGAIHDLKLGVHMRTSPENDGAPGDEQIACCAALNALSARLVDAEAKLAELTSTIGHMTAGVCESGTPLERLIELNRAIVEDEAKLAASEAIIDAARHYTKEHDTLGRQCRMCVALAAYDAIRARTETEGR
jgi:hypothetical protein